MFIPRAAAVALLIVLPLAAWAENEEQLVRDYTRLAGSEANAESLVNGLRNDETIKLTSDGKTTTFKPATDPMGYGNVKIALELAEASLAEQGIKNPTPEQIRAALNGGTLTLKSGKEVELTGVLEMRASGMGWGRIAQEHGFKLGELMRRDDVHKASLDRPDHARPQKLERPERPSRPERPERPERAHRR
jgi:hypothetical protein